MKRRKTEYPIGATWRGVDETGMIGEITLADRNETFEVWRWCKKYKDGSMPRHFSDWSTNYRSCHQEMNLFNRSTGKAVRLKRIK